MSFDIEEIKKIEGKMNQAITCCNQRKFSQAEQLISEIIKLSPYYSEAYRLQAQIKMEHGDIESAVNCCISALQNNPRNKYALLLMANLYVRKEQKNIAEAYYKRILEYYPEDSLAINNLAGLLLESKKYPEAIERFNQALSIDDSYINTHYGLALAYYQTDNFQNAFDISLRAVRQCKDRPENPGVRSELIKLTMQSAIGLCNSKDLSSYYKTAKEILENQDGFSIEFEESENIDSIAKLETAWIYGRKKHKVKYKPKSKFLPHLILHELTHLDLIQNASLRGANKKVFSAEGHLKKFQDRFVSDIEKKLGKVPQNVVDQVTRQLFGGLCSQIMNCPIDLFVEDSIYEKYTEMRPMQLLSLAEIENMNIGSIVQSEKSNHFPQKIVEVSKILNMVTTRHFLDLYGINLLPNYPNITQQQRTLADSLYDDYKKCNANYQYGD